MLDVGPLIAQTEPGGFFGFIDRLARTQLSTVVLFVAVCTILRVALYPYLVRTPEHLRMGAYTAARIFNELLDAVIYAGVLVFLVIRPFALQTFYIPSPSMVQTLQINDFILANKMIYRLRAPEHGEIVVFKPPKIALNPDQPEQTDFIKRCIGLPGDVVEIKDDQLYRNGKPVNEPYKVYTFAVGKNKYENMTPDQIRDRLDKFDFKLVDYNGKIIPLMITPFGVNPEMMSKFPIPPEDQERVRNLPAAKIPPGYFLMLGDNRNMSADGRFWGLVPRESIIARSEAIWMPLTRIRLTN